jgi:hypothetical protein
VTKYKSVKTKVDNIEFASTKEANRYTDLKYMTKANMIIDLVLQPKFSLCDNFKIGKSTFKAASYIADFLYYDIENSIFIVEEVKGFKTDLFILKKKIFLHQRLQGKELTFLYGDVHEDSTLEGATFRFKENEKLL